MRNDKTTLRDLSIFSSDGGGIFGLIDHTTTHNGREALRKLAHQPPASPEALQELQDTVRFWTEHPDSWPEIISNGTLVMLEKFFEAANTAAPAPGDISLLFGTFMQKFLNRSEYFFTQFSVSHIADFLKGCRQLCESAGGQAPALLQRELEAMRRELAHPLTDEVVAVGPDTPYKIMARISHRVRREMKPVILRLIQHYARIDAWQSLARATLHQGWHFPVLLPENPMRFEAEGLFHPLLGNPTAYTIAFGQSRNFLVLTGANMSGKTTFMRAMGVAAFLGHIGAGVPAAAMKMSFLEGIITNMHVEDNLLRGESYFFAEVQRMKQTAEKLIQPRAHLVLMDELFKGTNVHDAYECTRAVMEGLLKRPGHLMILSTHIYEAAQHFSDREGILFACFVTQLSEDNSYRFTYELRPGISNDRIGYRILQQAGVLDLLSSGTNFPER